MSTLAAWCWARVHGAHGLVYASSGRPELEESIAGAYIWKVRLKDRQETDMTQDRPNVSALNNHTYSRLPGLMKSKI